MFTMSQPVFFGDDNRFRAYQFDNDRFSKEWIAAFGDHTLMLNRSTIFVEDTQNRDELNLPEIVFQDWCENIESLEQIIMILRPKFPESFVGLQKYLDSQLLDFQIRFGKGKYPGQPLVDKWISHFDGRLHRIVF